MNCNIPVKENYIINTRAVVVRPQNTHGMKLDIFRLD